MPDLLFVYGSLRAGADASGLLAEAQFLGTAAIQGALDAVNGYPVLIEGSGWVHGELYRLPDGAARTRLLDALDRYEGLPDSRYRRATISIAGAEAWTYRSR